MKPNNFPREGKHNPVTSKGVKRLEQTRPVLNAERHYTIGGDTETQVYSNLNAEREAAITNGARSLNLASHKVRTGFEAAKPDKRTAYIQAQRQAVAHNPAQIRSQSHSQKRQIER